MLLKPIEEVPAYGETLGIEVPTRYSEDTHDYFNLLMAADSMVTPVMLRMHRRTVWLCRGLAALLVMTCRREGGPDARTRFEVEVGSGLLLLGVALGGRFTRNIFERSYLFIGGLLMIGNALMTQVKEPSTGIH